jgi:DNA-binding transcriptional regulator YiaG
MANFNAMFKQEVARLARKEVRASTDAIRKAATRHRSEIAGLKRQIAQLERQVGRLASGRAPVAQTQEAAEEGVKVRFSPKWVLADRKRLGLSAADYGLLFGVTGLTIYNWEKGRSKPRDKKLAAWAAVRGIGKREAMARLEELS